MSRVRDIAKFLGLTEANNPTNAALTSTADPAGLDSAGVTNIVDSDYVQSRQADIFRDSGFVTNIVDSDYVSIRAGGGGGGAFTIDDDNNIISSGSTASPTAGAGLRNFLVGDGAGGSITTGDENISIGRLSSNTITTSGQGIAIGSYAGYGATYGTGIAIGPNSAYNNTNHASSISLGLLAGSYGNGGSSIHIGSQSGQYNAGIYCIYMGDNAGNSSSTTSNGGDYNIGIGYHAGRNRNDGHNNVAIGKEAGGYNQSLINTGSNNVAIGMSSMRNAAGSYYENTFVGAYSGNELTSGYQNTGIGMYSGIIITTGYRNTLLGYDAGKKTNPLTTGNTNIAIGFDNGFNSNAAVQQNVIGTGLIGKGNFTTFIAGPAYQSNNSSSWAVTSDSRLKTNVTDYTTGLTLLDQLNVKTYNYLSDSDIATAHPELADSNGLVHEGLDTESTIVGIMAQDLETLLPNSVTTRENGIKSVNKDELFWVMLNSIKELKARVEALENA